MFSSTGLFRGHVYKVRIVLRSCPQDQDCLESQCCLEVMCSRSWYGCLEVVSTRSVMFRYHVYKVRIV